MVEGGGRVFWAVQGVLVGGLALLAGLTLQREVAMHKLHREVGELKGLLVAFSGREITFDEETERARRQIDLASRPEMLDYSYSGSLPPSNLNLNNLTVYWKLAGSEQSRSRNVLSRQRSGRGTEQEDSWLARAGLRRHHTVSAAWDGEGAGSPGREEQESWNSLFEGRSGPGESRGTGQRLDVAEVFQNERRTSQSNHRASRVSSTGLASAGHGFLAEVRPSDAQISRAPTYPSSSTSPPVTRPASTSPPVAIPAPTYKRPQLKSLGTPSEPTGPSTAIQLEAGDPTELRHDGRHTHWKLARWARRLGAASSFPLSPGGEVGVPSPGLYLVYAQVSYLDKSRQVGFSIEVNDRPKLVCSERRGAGMEISCYTGGLLYLEQGDRVSLLDSSPSSKVDNSRGNTFMGIVKLTGDWI